MSLRMELLISHACTQRCSFCMESSRMEEFVKAPVTVAEIVRVLAVQRRRGVDSVSFCGSGEPTLHPHLPDALRAAKKLGYQTELISNGSRLCDPGYASRVLPCVDRLWLSLHGHDAVLHDRLTGEPGSFVKLMRAFASARRQKGLLLGGVTVVTQANRGRMRDILRLALEQGARACQLTHVVPMGRAENVYAGLAVPHSWWRRNVPALAVIAKNKKAELLCAGVPLCALGSDWRRSRELTLGRTVSVDRIWNEGRADLRAEDLLPSADAASERSKPKACEGCEKREDCIGVPRPHAEAFADDGVRPFRRDGPRTERHEQGDGVEKILRINHACNQKCSFCFIPADGWKADVGVLERELDRLAPELGGAGVLTLSGGEPLAHPHLFKILGSARRRGIRRFTLQTNGVHLAKAGVLEKLVKLGVVGFDVSFHAHQAPLYDRLTGSRGQYPRAVAALAKVMARNEGYVSICIVINALNYRLLPAWAGFLGKMARDARRDLREPVRIGFTMLNGIGVDRAPDLAVDLALVKPFLRRAVVRCAREALLVQRSCGESDLTPCMAADPEAFVAESVLPQSRVRYADDFNVSDPSGGRAKRLA
ncbi:MAG: radical SAM protein, partial [Elusimicrobia bacterium]|nr:radical SAM protein [Elusimicrobiota bacterium]